MNLDFSYNAYRNILEAIKSSGYRVMTIGNYIVAGNRPEKTIVIRHDVDLDPYYQIRFAEMEHSFGFKTSYYFRYVDKIFKKEVIDKVHQLGHEIGYHYEVYTKAKGDEQKAMELFREELAIFKERWNIKTVCPHGGSFVDNTDGYTLTSMIRLIPKLLSRKQVFSKWVNFDMWSNNRFEDFGIEGDAYKSVDFSDILYLSDTGRSWDNRYKRLDKVNSAINPQFHVKSSNDLIRIIKNEQVATMYLLVHFEQWKDTYKDWFAYYLAQLIRRTGKRIVFGKNNKNTGAGNTQ